MQATHTDLSQPQGQPQPQGPEKLPGIRHIIAVGSGKGGVGKSTVSTNLALALQQTGANVGLVDADILGPSICGMLGINTSGQPAMTAEGKMIPAQRFGLKVVSMAMFTGDDTPAVLRGPMVTKYLRLFTAGVEWGNLDYLILDLPPGTGDTQLTIAQSTPLSGVVIVTTPQAVSLKIARRGLRMFQKVHVPILGIVENMRTFTCPHCGETTDIFRHGGGHQCLGNTRSDLGQGDLLHLRQACERMHDAPDSAKQTHIRGDRTHGSQHRQVGFNRVHFALQAGAHGATGTVHQQAAIGDTPFTQFLVFAHTTGKNTFHGARELGVLLRRCKQLLQTFA